MSSRPVDDYCTHEQLADEIGGTQELATLLPAQAAGSSTAFRQRAVDLVLKALKRRTPPIVEADLANLEDVRDAVVYCTLEHLYSLAMTGGEGIYAEKRKLYAERYEAEMDGMRPEVGDLGETVAGSWAVERR